MSVGYVRDHLPRVTLSLPGREQEFSVEFVLDTGFDGELALLARLDAEFSQERVIRLVDGTVRHQPFYEIMLEWFDETRVVEITLLESEPLLGALLLEGFLIQIEMMDGGEVSFPTPA